jgi:TolA-binding protein
MKIEELKLELEKERFLYQNMIDEFLPKSGNLSEIDENNKKKLLHQRDKLRLLQKEISQLEDLNMDDAQHEEFIKKLKEKFNDE